MVVLSRCGEVAEGGWVPSGATSVWQPPTLCRNRLRHALVQAPTCPRPACPRRPPAGAGTWHGQQEGGKPRTAGVTLLHGVRACAGGVARRPVHVPYAELSERKDTARPGAAGSNQVLQPNQPRTDRTFVYDGTRPHSAPQHTRTKMLNNAGTRRHILWQGPSASMSAPAAYPGPGLAVAGGRKPA